MVTPKSLNIIQWNARSLKHKLNELHNYSMNTDIFLISESWLEVEGSIYFRDFDIIRKDRIGRRGGGVLVMVKLNVLSNILSLKTFRIVMALLKFAA